MVSQKNKCYTNKQSPQKMKESNNDQQTSKLKKIIRRVEKT